MTVFDEIINNFKLNKNTETEVNSLEIVPSQEAININKIETIEDLNKIYKTFDFPIIENRILENTQGLIDVLNNLNLEYTRCGLDFSDEFNDVIRTQEKINKFNEYEKECDMMEIEYANMKEEIKEFDNYKKYNVEDLRKELLDIKNECTSLKNKEKYFDLLNKIRKFVEDGIIEDDLKGFLSYMKETTEYQRLYEKNQIIQNVLNMPESNNVKICKLLISKKMVSLSELEKELNLNRINILKIVYSLLSRNVIIFDRSSDVIYLKT